MGVYLLVLDSLMILQILTIWWRTQSILSFLTSYTKSDTRVLRRQSSDSWMLVSLLPDLEVSDLKKSQSNHKSNGDNLSLHCLTLYHKWMLWVFVFYIQRSWPVLWSLDVWFCLDACLLSSGYDHRWYRATQQAIYVASVEEMAYIVGTWVVTVMWPVMIQTILISNVQEKKWKKLAGLLGEVGDDNIRAEWKCHAEHTSSLRR